MNQIVIEWNVWIDQGVEVGGNHYTVFWHPDRCTGEISNNAGSLISDVDPQKMIAWAEKYLRAKNWTVSDDPYYPGKKRYEALTNVDIVKWRAGRPVVRKRNAEDESRKEFFG